jgi:hypothetical protein
MAAPSGYDIVQNILHLTLRREPFAAIAAKRKHVGIESKKPIGASVSRDEITT